MTTVRVAPLGGPSLMTVVRPPASAAEAAAAGLERGAPVMGPTIDRAPHRRPSTRDAARAVRTGRMAGCASSPPTSTGSGPPYVAGACPGSPTREPDVLCLQEVRASDAQLTAGPDGRGLRRLARRPRALWHRGAGRRRGACPAPRTGASGASWRTRPASRPDGGWRPSSTCRPGPVTVVSVYVHTGEARDPAAGGEVPLPGRHDHADEGAGRRRPSASWWPATSTSPTPAADLRNWKGNLGKAGFLPAEQAYLDRWLDRRVGGRVPPGGRGGGRAVHVVVLARQGLRQRHRVADRLPAGLGGAGAAGCPGTWVGRAATYAERWSDHAAVVADYDLA